MRIVLKRIGAAALALLAGFASPARADLIFGVGGFNPFGTGSEMTTNIAAGGFLIGSPLGATITDISFLEEELPGGFTGTIAWSIYQDSGGTPGTVVASGTTSSVSHSLTGYVDNYDSGLQVYSDDFSIGSVTLGPGIYWLGLHNGTLSHVENDTVFWAGAGASNIYSPDNLTYDLTTAGPWYAGFSTSVTLSFELYGQIGVTASVPEPSSLIMGGTAAILGLGYTRFPRRRAPAACGD